MAKRKPSSPFPSPSVNFYMGNTRLLAAGYQHPYTQAEIEEFAKCSDDPIHFIKTYIKIVHPDHGLVPFALWPFQERMVEAFHHHRFVIEKCPRQCGKSTVIIAYFLHQILFQQNFSVCIAAQREKTSIQLLKRLKRAYENLPFFLQQGVVKWDEKTIELANGSLATAAATSSSAVRGESHNILLLDEFAHVLPNVADEFMASTFPTISAGETTKIFICSTPKGFNLFRLLWIESERDKDEHGCGVNGFFPVSVHWSEVPGRDAAWMKRTIALMGQEKFNQEYSTDFLVGDDTLISSVKLQQLTWMPDSDLGPERLKGLKIFKECIREIRQEVEGKMVVTQPAHMYVVPVDTAAGIGGDGDASAFCVIDISTVPYEIVATFADNTIPTMQYPQVVFDLARHYNTAFVLCELTNDLGQQIADILRYEFEYDNIVTTIQKPKQGPQISGGFSKSVMWGLKMNRSVKKMGCATLKTLVETNKLVLNDHRVVHELSTFVKSATAPTKGYEAQSPNHDDLVMSLVVFAWMTQQQYFIDLTLTNVRTGLLKVQQETIDECIPFGVIIDRTNPPPEAGQVAQTPANEWTVPKSELADRNFNWLVR